MVDDTQKIPDKAQVGVYPFNQVTVWPDGRELHINYTPDNFTTRFFSAIGTGFEIDKFGRFVHITANNSYSYSLGGSSSTTDKNSDTKIGGGSRSTISKGSHSESKSTTSVVSGKSVSISKDAQISMSGGSSSEAPQESISTGNRSGIIKGSNSTKITGSNMIVVAGQHMIISGSDKHETIYGNHTVHDHGNALKLVEGEHKILVTGKLTIIADSIEITSKSTIDMEAEGNVTIKGAEIHLNP